MGCPQYPLVVVDGANLHYVLRALNVARIDLQKFRMLLTDGRYAPREYTRWYTAMPMEADRIIKTQRFLGHLNTAGWQVVTKPITKVYSADGILMAVKGNLDVEIAWDVSSFLSRVPQRRNIGRLVVVSGDRDFTLFIHEAHERYIPVTWVGSHLNMAGEIRNTLNEGHGDKLIMIENILEDLVISYTGSSGQDTEL